MKKTLEISLALITIGGALIAIAQSEPFFQKLANIPSIFYTATLMVGATITGLGLVVLLLGLLKNTQRLVGEVEYSCDPVVYGDIPGFLKFCRQFFDDELPTVERVRGWHRKNQNIIYYVKRKRRFLSFSFERIVGCFGVLPVNSETARRLSENSLIGSALSSDNIVSPMKQPAAYYIGVLAAKGLKNKKETLLALLGNINAKLEAHKVPLFTRPITKDGERLVAKYKFAPVMINYSRPKDVIFKRE